MRNLNTNKIYMCISSFHSLIHWYAHHRIKTKIKLYIFLFYKCRFRIDAAALSSSFVCLFLKLRGHDIPLLPTLPFHFIFPLISKHQRLYLSTRIMCHKYGNFLGLILLEVLFLCPFCLILPYLFIMIPWKHAMNSFYSGSGRIQGPSFYPIK